MSEILFGQDVLEQPSANFKRDGIFTNTGKVVEARLGYQVPAMAGWTPNNLVLTLKLALTGRDFQKDIIIAGDYEWIENGSHKGSKVIDFKSTFRIFDIITILRRNGHLKKSWAPNPDGTLSVDGKPLLPPEGESWVNISEYFANAQIVFIDYLTNFPRADDPSKMKSYTYRNVTAIYPNEVQIDAEARLKGRFMKDLAAGYVKNYAQAGSAAQQAAESTAQGTAAGAEAPFDKF